MHVVVTGGAGFIGSHLVEALLAREDTTVLVLDNFYRGRMGNLTQHHTNPRLRCLNGDVRDRAMLPDAFHGAELVYHLAAQSNVMGAVSDPRYSFETNVAGTFNVLEAALKAGVRRVVFTSSREAYGEARLLPVSEEQPLLAKNTYGASKVAGEVYCQTFAGSFGLETAVLRLANVYGPRDHGRVIPLWIERATAGEPLDVHGGEQVLDFIWVGTVVEALLRAADAAIAGTPVNIGSGTGTPIRDLAHRILTETGSFSELRTGPARQAEVVRFVADVSRMQTLLGITPPADPLAGLSALIPRAAAHAGAARDAYALRR